MPAGRHGDRHSTARMFADRAALFAARYAWSAAGPAQPARPLPALVLAGLGIGCAETAESAVVTALAPARLRGRHSGGWPRLVGREP